MGRWRPGLEFLALAAPMVLATLAIGVGLYGLWAVWTWVAG